MSVEHTGCYSEDDIPEEVHSPTDSSEDSVEVKVSPISGRNKRKCAEPRRVHEPTAFTGPLKKRMCLQARAESEQRQPFRPWSKDQAKNDEPEENPPVNLKVPNKLESVPINFNVPYQPQNVSVFASPVSGYSSSSSHGFFRPPSPIKQNREPSPKPVSLVIKRESEATSTTLRVPTHPQPNVPVMERDNIVRTSEEAFPRLQTRKEQRNYKNMTRERRIEANARERTRVHTISAAFDTLRRAIPAYSHSQKLSKLSVLRIACSYIMTLSDVVQDDAPAVAEGIEAVSRTIQREGKLRKKKDDE